MSATKKVSTLQRLARVWEDSAIELDAAIELGATLRVELPPKDAAGFVVGLVGTLTALWPG